MGAGCCGFIPIRLLIAIMLFFATWGLYMLRVNMSVTIIAMVINKPGEEEDPGIPEDEVRYNWSETVQATILASYGYGYILSQVVGGIVAEVLGARRVVMACMTTMTCLTALTPWAASVHYGLMVIVRVLLGFSGGAMFPAMHSCVAKWAPPNERSKFVSALLGGTFGTAVTFPMCGLIIKHLSWEASFYIVAALGAMLCVIWWLIVHDTPDEHPCISEEEANYIKSAIGARETTTRVLPMIRALTSIPFIILIVFHFGNLWGLFFLMTMGPKFYADALDMDISESGGLSSFPYIGRFFIGLIFAALADYLIGNGILSKTLTRKIFTLISHIIPGILMLIMCFSGHNLTLAVAALSVGIALNGAVTATNLSNHFDLAPNFAGTLYGIMNSIGSLASFIAPQVTGFILQTENTFAQWRIAFFITIAFYIGSGTLFILAGSTSEQPWNTPDKS